MATNLTAPRLQELKQADAATLRRIWAELSERYDDDGSSGGSMERPGLEALLNDVRDGRVDVIVVYKVDRLTRSLADFAKMVDVFDGAGGGVRVGHTGVQHHIVDGASNFECAIVLCAV